jgi:protein-tyrosine kinase
MSLIERALEKHRRQGDKPSAARPPLAPASAVSEVLATHRELSVGPEVVELDVVQLRMRGYMPAEEAMSEMMHQFRRLKRPLVVNALQRDAGTALSSRIIAVASAVAGEGKSFTSLNLAMSLAIERDFNVLLIDGDIARGALTSALGLGDQQGLLDLLSDTDRSIESCVRRTSLEGLYVLPCGKWRDNAPELLGSTRLKRMLSDVTARYPGCLVVCDTAPVMLTNEGAVFLSIAGQVVFIVSSGSTPRQSVIDSLALIPGDRAISMVLNKFAGEVDSGYQYYGQHYDARAEKSG